VGDRVALVDRRLAEIEAVQARETTALLRRTPSYCSGCPHNVSTHVLPGQIAWSAPGCHVFANLIEQPERHADATFQLGGEGLAWVGLSPFTDRAHVVQNQGDGALFHSSYLNIRFAVAAGVHMTFRILYNGAVANTGGQAPVGQHDVPTLARLLALEGVTRIAIVARDPSAYRGEELPAVVSIHAREAVPQVLRDLEATPGVTVFLYDGECANERRRKQKRDLRPAATRFVLVNEEVCENCGDCGVRSNCMSLHKVETELGPKTQIHQSSCNQDHLCLVGDCPSFVTIDVRGGGRRKPAPPVLEADHLPEPDRPRLDEPFHVVLPGVGGTGVLTINSLLAWGALLDGNSVQSYDQTGAAQKWGAVLSSIVIAGPSAPVASNKVGLGRADLYLALDAMAAADRVNLARCDPRRTALVLNTSLLPTGEMIRDVGLDPGAERLAAAVARVCDPSRTVRVEARRVAEALFGDFMATNVFALGVAYQAGLLPVSARSIEAAIALNGTAVGQNLQAFRYGRLHRIDPARVDPALARPAPATAAQRAAREAEDLGRDGPAYLAMMAEARELPEPERRMVSYRLAELIRYQDVRHAATYLGRVLATFQRERQVMGSAAEPLVTRAVLGGLHKLMAYKDEYEVARLHLRAAMQQRAEQLFDGQVRIHYQLHPPVLRALGMRRKLRLGRWFERVLSLLARMKFVRGTPFDPFGLAEVRRLERSLVRWYGEQLDAALPRLRPDNQARVAELAALPEEIRGYERLKIESAERAMRRAEALLAGLAETHALAVVP
jgi:indolepyruvate ferredoxin oxidoreductase